jgi:hypothetical protein
VHRESIDPDYWRKKAAAFRWLAHSASPQESQVLARRATEFMAMAALMHEGEARPSAAPRAGLFSGRRLVLASCVAGCLIAVLLAVWLDRGSPGAVAAAQPVDMPSRDAPAPSEASPSSAAPAILAPPSAGTATVAPALPERTTALADAVPLAAAAMPASLPRPSPTPTPESAPMPPAASGTARHRTHFRKRLRVARRQITIFGYRLPVSPPPDRTSRPIP